MRSWAGEDVIHLHPEDWFERGHVWVGKWIKTILRDPSLKGGVIFGSLPLLPQMQLWRSCCKLARSVRILFTFSFAPSFELPSGKNNFARWLMLFLLCLSAPHFGLLTVSNLVLSACASLFSRPGPGRHKEALRCTQWEGNCLRCLKKGTQTKGLFCANFATSPNACPPCQAMWCGECCTSSEHLEFQTQVDPRILDEESDGTVVEDGWPRNPWKTSKPDPLLSSVPGTEII
jgi:hypothetical protein